MTVLAWGKPKWVPKTGWGDMEGTGSHAEEHRLPQRKRRPHGFKGESDDMDLTTCRIMYFNINTVIRLLLKRCPLPTALHNFLR